MLNSLKELVFDAYHRNEELWWVRSAPPTLKKTEKKIDNVAIKGGLSKLRVLQRFACVLNGERPDRNLDWAVKEYCIVLLHLL